MVLIKIKQNIPNQLKLIRLTSIFIKNVSVYVPESVCELGFETKSELLLGYVFFVEIFISNS